MDLKIVDIKSITLEQCIYFSKLGLYFVIHDGKLKGFTR